MAEAGRAALWSAEALDDRERIWEYYVRVAGRHTAEKVLRDCADLRPSLRGRALNAVRPGLRSFAASPHVIFYRVVDDTPEIVRVLDGRQDIEEKFAARDGE